MRRLYVPLTRHEANVKFMRMHLVYDDPPEIVILKKGRSYHAVVADSDRVSNILTMQRPMPTVIATLEHLLNVTAEHLANIGECSAEETVENDLLVNRGTLHVPPLTPSVTSESDPSKSDEDANPARRDSSAPSSFEESPPPAYTRLPVADPSPTPVASPDGRGTRAQARRRPASATGDADEDDPSRGNTLRRSTRIRRSYGRA